tara:strand:+ start:25529 stop:25912 length:384 start_codon:yes stop_codon:yes gene_type:complete
MLLNDCINIYQAFQKLSTTSLPLKSSWLIAQNINKLQPLVETFEESRKTYIKTLQDKAVLDEEGNPTVSDELAAEFKVQVEELLNEEQKVRLKKVTLVDDGNLSIEPNILLVAMDYLILKDDGDKTS